MRFPLGTMIQFNQKLSPSVLVLCWTIAPIEIMLRSIRATGSDMSIKEIQKNCKYSFSSHSESRRSCSIQNFETDAVKVFNSIDSDNNGIVSLI